MSDKEAEREKQAPCREPDVGLDPRSPGSHPGTKAGAKPLSHPGVPKKAFKNGKRWAAWLAQQLSACLWPRA